MWQYWALVMKEIDLGLLLGLPWDFQWEIELGLLLGLQ
jgi:hypothetical protein